MVTIARYGAVAALIAVVAGCGGSSETVTFSSQVATTASATSMPELTPPVAPPSAIRLPPSPEHPTTCTVYEAGFATQVIFASESLDVRAACQAWTRNRAGVGYLWGYQPSNLALDPGEAIQVCSLTNATGDVSASVIQDAGFRAVSAYEEENGSAACRGLVATGWIGQVDLPTNGKARKPRPARRS